MTVKFGKSPADWWLIIVALFIVFGTVAMAVRSCKGHQARAQAAVSATSRPSAVPTASVTPRVRDAMAEAPTPKPSPWKTVEELGALQGHWTGLHSAYADFLSRAKASDNNVRYGSPYPWRIVIQPGWEAGRTPYTCGFYTKLNYGGKADAEQWRVAFCHGGTLDAKGGSYATRLVLLLRKDDSHRLTVQLGDLFRIELQGPSKK